MISESDVINGYLWILGRCPVADEVTAFRNYYSGSALEGAPDFQKVLISSEEFRNRRTHIARWMRNEPVNLHRFKTVFMHIEKCGGTTLHTMLSAQFEASRICPERFDGLGDLTINELASYDLFSGHYDLCFCRAIPGNDVRIITMLREPKARLLSLFYFWKAHIPNHGRDYRSLIGIARNSTAQEFFSHPFVLRHPSINNAIAGQLIRTTVSAHVLEQIPVLEADDPIVCDPARALTLAWRNLRRLAGFGILEHHETSRVLLNDLLGLTMQSIEPQQVLDNIVLDRSELTPVQREPLTDQLDGLLDALTEIDRPLYARALELFKSRAEAIRLSHDASATPEFAPDRHERE